MIFGNGERGPAVRFDVRPGEAARYARSRYPTRERFGSTPVGEIRQLDQRVYGGRREQAAYEYAGKQYQGGCHDFLDLEGEVGKLRQTTSITLSS
jgi:hypothetical protein